MDPVVTPPVKTKRVKLTHVVLPVLSAVLLSFCFPFASAWWMAWLALVPLYYVLLRANGSPRSGFVCGFWFGLALHLVGVYWMTKLGTVPWIGVAVIESGGFAFFGAVAAPLLYRLPTWARPVVFGALWTCLEYGRTLSEVAFPWFPLAATQVPVLPMVQVVSVAGQWGLSFAIALVNGLLLEAYQAHRFRAVAWFRWLAGAAVYVPIALALGGRFVMWALDNPEIGGAGNEHAVRKVAIVQGNVGKVPENADYDVLDQYRSSALETYLQMTRFAGREAASDVSFVLWPETVVPGYLLLEPTLQFPISSLAREIGTDLLVGTMHAGGKDERFNSVVHLDPAGKVARTYAKQRLVPMGEFFLFRNVLGDIYDKYEVPNEDLTPGHEPGVFTVGEGTKATRVGMLICYEAVFPYISRGRVRDGAEVLVQATSDQTFDGTPNPQQHADLCVLRAVETRRYFVRAGATGLSQIIDSSGRVRRNIPSLKAGTIIDSFVIDRDETLFVRFGDWFVGLCAIITGSGIAYVLSRKRPAPVPDFRTPSSEEDALPEQTTRP